MQFVDLDAGTEYRQLSIWGIFFAVWSVIEIEWLADAISRVDAGQWLEKLREDWKKIWDMVLPKYNDKYDSRVFDKATQAEIAHFGVLLYNIAKWE